MKKITNTISLTSWLLLWFSLTLSDMVSPDRVKWFLDISWKWDPTLLFVMLFAVTISIIGHYSLSKRHKPHFAEKWHFDWKKKWIIDKKLIIWSILFWIGWWIWWTCPWPAIASFMMFDTYLLTFIFSMILTMWIYKIYFTN